MSRSILALDLGTHTGYALSSASRGFVVGTWALACPKQITLWGKTRMTRRCDPRVSLFHSTLRSLKASSDLEQVVFEDVQFSSSTYQTQLWASFRATIWCVFGSEPGVLIECVPTGTLKKFATGHGGATKEMMESALFRSHPEWKSANLSDDAIDALWLWYWADRHLKQA